MIWEFFDEVYENAYWSEDECFDEIQKGDKVWYEDQQGETQSATAYKLTYRGMLCFNDKTEPVYVNEGHNYLAHQRGRQ